ncbi:MAG: hypothetical protein ACLGJC_09055 [Alphaproteobacteria bacterium]
MSITEAHRNRLVQQGRNELMTAWLQALPAAPNENKQRDAAARFEGVMVTLIEEMVGVIAAVDFPAFPVKLDNLDGKGKVVLKAADPAKAGQALISHVGSSLTLVLTDLESFDEEREAARIELDQPDLPLEVEPQDDGEDFAGEAAEIAEEAASSDPASEDAGWLFTAVEDEPCRLPDGSSITPWAVVHRDLEVFTPVNAKDFVHAAVDHLNSTAVELERDMTPAEVRNGVLSVLRARQEEIGLAFHSPYSEDAPAVQDNAPSTTEEAPKGKRGQKSAAEKVEAYFAGYDGAASDLFTEDCPHERGSLRDNWIIGLEDAKAGKAPRWNRPTQPAANDDGEPRESTGNMAA